LQAAAIALKVNISDTAAMLAPYWRKVDTAAIIATQYYVTTHSAGSYTLPTASTTVLGGVKIDNSTITLNGSSQLVVTTDNTKLNKTDTTAMLAPYLRSNIAAATYVNLGGSYTNPSWLVSIPWSKITSTPTTIGGYGITDGVTLTGVQTLTNKTIDAGQLTGSIAAGRYAAGTIPVFSYKCNRWCQWKGFKLRWYLGIFGR
jgi:hypothetical protein